MADSPTSECAPGALDGEECGPVGEEVAAAREEVGAHTRPEMRAEPDMSVDEAAMPGTPFAKTRILGFECIVEVVLVHCREHVHSVQRMH